MSNKCFTEQPLGVKYIDRVVEKVVVKEVTFDPAKFLNAPMVGSGGTVYTQAVATPRGRVGVGDVGSQEIRIRIELTPGSKVNESVIAGSGFTRKSGGHYSGVFSCEKAVSALITASRAISL